MPSTPDFLTLTHGTLASSRRHAEARPCLLPDSIALAAERIALPDDFPREPTIAVVPFLIEFDERRRLDPDRADIPPDTPPASPTGRSGPGPIASLLIHLLALALLMAPAAVPPEPPPPIPVQLVLEKPPPPAPPKPVPKPAPHELVRPPGRLSSVDMGDVHAKSTRSGVDKTVTPQRNTPVLVPPPPKPTPPGQQVAALAVPKIAPPTAEPRRPNQHPHAASHPAKIPGPAATRDEYLAYLAMLTRQHLNVLPLSLVGDRRGVTKIGVRINDDGSIAQIRVEQGSGYPEIDRRVEAMVAACRRFPPLPQWFQGQSMEVIFTLYFPEALEHP